MVDGDNKEKFLEIKDIKKGFGEGDLTQYRRRHLGYVFQLYNLIPNLNVKENIEVGAFLADASGRYLWTRR